MKKVLSLFLSIIMLFSITAGLNIEAFAKADNAEVITVSPLKASISKKNSKARKKYNSYLKKIKKRYGGVSYAMLDLTGDGIVDLIADYISERGSGNYFKIYTCKSGKLKCIYDGGEYGLGKLLFYKKTKTLIMKTEGHGGQSVSYYKYNGKKFKEVASAGRHMNDYSEEYSDWGYTDMRSYEEIGKSEFNSIVKPLKKGSKKVIKLKNK